MSKYKAKSQSKFRSKFEVTCAEKLLEAGIEFEYEPHAITLTEGFTTKARSWERNRKTFKEVSSKIRPITYTPDFVGKGWIIETKGMRTPDFNLKWKLLKLKFKNKKIQLFLPQSVKELDQAIQIIQNGLLQNKPHIKLAAKLAAESASCQDETR